jgi:hypothetical protein
VQAVYTSLLLRPKPAWLEPLFRWAQDQILVNGRNMAYIDEGNRHGRPVLLLSGNPTWGVLYRDFIEPLTAAGYRAIVPIGLAQAIPIIRASTPH